MFQLRMFQSRLIIYFFRLEQMEQNSFGRYFILSLLLAIVSHAAIINNPSQTQQPAISQNAVFFTTVSNVPDRSSPTAILSQLAVPGFSRKHGFNYVSLDGWSCSHPHGPAISIWESLNLHLGTSFAESDSETRKIIKQFYQASGVKLLVNAFGSYENPVSSKIDAAECAGKLLTFIDAYSLDGANIDFRDVSSFQSGGLAWLTNFMLGLTRTTSRQYIFTHSVDVGLFDHAQYPTGDYSLLEKAVGRSINFYNIRYFTPKSNFTHFKEIFTMGTLSVSGLVQKGVPINKIVISRPSIYNMTGFVRSQKLMYFYRKANAQMSWWGGAMFYPYIDQEAEDETRFVTLRRDNIEPISATNLDSVNFWWPPEKTVADIGVPGYAPNNMYNTFSFGVWTCKSGAFDISRLWSQASFYLSTAFGNTTEEIQAFLKEKYEAKGKKILVRAFGTAQSPTSGNQDPIICAKSLAKFVKSNGLDGVDISYQDNTAFNNGIAEDWLISFSNTLRDLMPFHLISHSIQNYLLDRTKYRGGSYTRVISTVGNLLDFYSITYYGQQHTSFTTYQELFENSGSEFTNISITQLVASGFDLDKTVVGKPVRLFDAQGAGFIEPQALREIFLQASAKLNWRGGISYSSYLNDQDGKNVLRLLRGINRTDSKRLAYVDNVNKWWPPQATLGQMGVPTLAASNIYNYFAYAFWTCGSGPQAISKLYNDPVTYLGTDLGKDKAEIQAYIKNLYTKADVKLLVSAFGASEFPVNSSLNAVDCGKKMVSFMEGNLLDGIDIDFQDSDAFRLGIGEEWINVFMRQVRKSKPFHIITHAPQAPYFDPKFAQSGSYLTINEVSGKFIDFYNVQFYNQGNTTYTTYEGLFLDSGTPNSNTSVFQIIKQGIEPQKVVLGKPVTQADAYNTGVVPSSVLKGFLKKAVSDPANPGWSPSVMYWQFLSDLTGASIAEAMNYQS